MQLSPAIPILRIFSEQKAREHYLDFLGFSCEWEHRFEEGMPLYMEVKRGDLVIHLSEHHGDATPGSTIFVHVADIDTLHQELIAKNDAYARPGVDDFPWGRVMQVGDPFGNRIRFCQPPA